MYFDTKSFETYIWTMFVWFLYDLSLYYLIDLKSNLFALQILRMTVSFYEKKLKWLIWGNVGIFLNTYSSTSFQNQNFRTFELQEYFSLSVLYNVKPLIF